MASVSQNAIARPLYRIAGRKGFIDKNFYLTMSLLIAAIVVWGFSHTINDHLFHPAVLRPTLLWFHGAVFTSWVAFFIFQSALVRTHNVKLHRTTGWFGVALGTAMPPLGIATAIVMGRFDMHTLHEPDVDTFLIVPFYDMLVFAILFALAVLWRRKPEFHRRLIFIATCCLLDAAFGRVDYLFNHDLYFWCLDGVILLGVARDLLIDRRVHKVYLVTVPILLVAQFFVISTYRCASPWWVAIAHSILG